MIQRADTVGVFQIESRAQMSMLPRLKPKEFYDLVVEVAIVRPGPIQGKMVHPYLRRRCGQEHVVYPSEAVRDVLKKTLGVPLFQEQAMKLVVVAAGFTPGEADQLRRAMGAWKRNGAINQFEQKLIQGMLANGYTEEFARNLFTRSKASALWLPGIPCGVVRPARLHFGLDQMPSSRGFPGGPPEQPADGFLWTGPIGGRRAPAWRRGASR